MRPSNDREAITLILQGLVDTGHTIYEVADDTWNLDQRWQVSMVETAVDYVDNVDEAYVFLLTPNREDAWIRFVLGNEPEEVACDYTTNLDPDLSDIVDPWWS